MKLWLYETEYQSDSISPNHPLAYQEYRKPKKHFTDRKVIRSQSFQDTDHVGTFDNNNQQTGNHGKACYPDHQNQNHPHIQIEQSKPLEYLRIGLLYILHKIYTAIFIRPVIRAFGHLIGDVWQTVIILHLQLRTAHLIGFPIIQPVYGI